MSSTTRSEASGTARRHSLCAISTATAGLLVGLLVAISAQRATAAQPRVLILYTAGDPNMEAGRAHVTSVYTQNGFLVDALTSMPSDLGPYCCAWDIRARDVLTASEQNQYLSFLDAGHGVCLIGENSGCCAPRDASVADFISLAGGGAVSIGSDLIGTIAETTTPHPVCRNPNNINQITYDGFGAGTFNNVGRGAVLTYYPPTLSDWVAAAWSQGRLLNAPDGRLVAVLDINWLDETYNQTHENFVENIAAFLCPITTASLVTTITSPTGFDLQCPATIALSGNIAGTDVGCVPPTQLVGLNANAIAPLPFTPRPHSPGDIPPGEEVPPTAAGPGHDAAEAPDNPSAPVPQAVRITSIKVSVNGGPFTNVTSTSPALPSFPPVTFQVTNLAIPLGNDTISVRATDENNLTSTDTLTGIVRDTLPPVISPPTCADATVDLGAGCQLSYTGVPTATDLCDPSVLITSVPALPIVFTGPGQAVIAYTARDDSNNTAQCTRTVTAVDLSAPTLTCAPATTLECNAAGGRPLADADIQAFLALTTASDNCDANPPVTNDAPPFFPSACPPGLGTTVHWTTSDQSGHVATCSSVLSVEDTTPPQITGTPGPLTLECSVPGGVPSSNAAVLAWMALFTAADLCEPGVDLGNDAPPLLPLSCTGPGTTVTFSAVDSCPNTATFPQMLTVRDTIAPSLTPPQPLTIECVGPTGVPSSNGAIAMWRTSATATDLCSTPSITDNSPPAFPVGCGVGLLTPVTFTATDSCLNAATAPSSVTVTDLSAPTLLVPPALTIECNGPNGVSRTDPQIAVWLGQASASDVCHTFTLTNNAPLLFPSGCGPAGHVTTVTFTATDACGNVRTVTSTVTVRDTTAPSLVVPPPLVLECNGPGGVGRNDPQIVAWLAQAAAGDVCGTAQVTNNAPPVLFPSGCGAGNVTTVTFTATDGCGNSRSLSSTITVRDTTPPTLTTPHLLDLECNGPGGVLRSDPQVQAWLLTAVSSDACGSAVVTNNAPLLFPSSCNFATTTVTFTATDGCGLTTTVTANVWVHDLTRPVLSVPPSLTLECNGPAGVSGLDPQVLAWLQLATATDTCDGATVTNTAPALFPSGCTAATGTTTVTFLAIDNCLNAVTATSSVVVLDRTPPTVTPPPPLTLECSAFGGVPRTSPPAATWLALAAATDVCDGATLSNNAPPLFPSSCLPGGNPTTVTFTATDNCANAGQAPSVLTVVDTTPPQLTAPPPITLECTAPGGIPASDPAVQAWLLSAVSSDVCSAAPVTNNAPPLFPSACVPGQTTVVTFTATDTCANATQRTSSLTARDITPPDLTGCGITPWDIELGQPRPPQPAADPRSCDSGGAFRIDCGTASDVCDTSPLARTAEIRARRHDVVNGACVEVLETIPVACDEIVELRLDAPLCPSDRAPRSPRPPVVVGSNGIRVIRGESLLLHVVATDTCGNISTPCTLDPATAPDPTNPGQPLLCPPAPPRCRDPLCGQ